MIQLLSTITLVGFVGMAAFGDLRTRTIPNWLTFSFLSISLALRSFAGAAGLLDGMAGAGIALGFALPLFLLGALGGGDGKLLMGVGALLGVERLWIALLAMAIAGGLLAAAEMVRRRAVVGTLLGVHAVLVDSRPIAQWKTIRTPGSLTIPYGVAIAVGALAGWIA
jgi:prepilin peptidase CpaA